MKNLELLSNQNTYRFWILNSFMKNWKKLKKHLQEKYKELHSDIGDFQKDLNQNQNVITNRNIKEAV